MSEAWINGKKITIQHFLSDGREIEDLSQYTLPPDSPVYEFMADLIRRNLAISKMKETESSAE